MITLLNSPILTTFGKFEYRQIDLDQARLLVQTQPWQSAIGHASTAQVISELLGIECLQNRVQISYAVGEQILVFAPATRLPEGVVFTREEMRRFQYSWGLLDRLE